jgi:hypothetical protein
VNRLTRWSSVSAICCLPVVIGLARFIGRDVVLDGDQAVFAMQVRDAATGGFPTMGLYSWNGWNHPGPIAFYLYAPFHWLSGGATWGTLLATGVWSVATVFLTGWLAARRHRADDGAGGSPEFGRHPLVVVCLAIQLATWVAVGGTGVIDPWTPNLAASLVVPFLLAVWGMAEGDRTATICAVGIGAVATQLHVGYAALVGVCGLVALVVSRRRRLGVPIVVLLWAAALGLLLWLPVTIDVVTSRTGNLRTLARYFRSGVPQPAGLGEGMRIMAGELSPWPTWVTGPRPQGLFLEARQSSSIWLFAAVALVAVALLVRRSTPLIIAITALMTATFACGQLRGFRYHYLVYWRTPIVLFALVMAVGTLLRRRRRASRWLAGAALVGALGAVSWAVARADQVTRYGDAIADLTDQIAAARPTGRVLLELGDGGVVGALPGILHDLELRGDDVGVRSEIEWVVGDRGIDPATADQVWFVTDNGWSLSLLTLDPRGTLIAGRTPYDAATETRVRALQSALAAQLRAAGRTDAIRSLDSALVGLALDGIAGISRDAVAELADLNRDLGGPGHRLGVVAFPPDAAPDIWWPVNAL